MSHIGQVPEALFPFPVPAQVLTRLNVPGGTVADIHMVFEHNQGYSVSEKDVTLPLWLEGTAWEV